ncbi:MAG: 5'-nucleotidase C-terminal domain-containing protein [Candidatus Cloacimonetes bacterium]|nr:5'-nucleotidase C-terminal domain-containing protein [Candidatus Cloacimonadota bacterium]
MKKNLIFFILIFPFFLFSLIDTLFVLNTTDIHGQIFPYDYYLDEPADYGLAKIHTLVKKYRRSHPDIILLDSGDLFEGSFFDHKYLAENPDIIHPYIKAFNMMGYDAFTPGNHDIETGREIYGTGRDESGFPWLAANSVITPWQTYFLPYFIKEINNIKVGILGISTPSLKRLKQDDKPEICWMDIETTLEEFLPELRSQVDILIGSFHFGLEELEALPDFANQFDVMFGGHIHSTIPAINDTIITTSEPVQIISGNHAKSLGVVKLVFQKTDDTFQIIEKSAWNENIKNEVPAPEFQVFQDYHQEKIEFMNQTVGIIQDTLTTVYSRRQDSAVLEMINHAQMQFADCDISFTSCFDASLVFAPGIINYKDILSLYKYKNKLCVVELTGKQIKQYLEYCTNYFLWQDDQIQINPEMKGYNYDVAEGLNYEIDVSKPVGKRIIKLQLTANDKDLVPEKKYKVAMNNYRASGGGGHLKNIGADQNNIISTSEKTIPEILLEYVSNKNIIENEVDSNWSILQYSK